MTAETARQERAARRRQQILDVARKRADAEGWSAVTTRHLAGAIGFTQPVLYGHFPGGKAEIMLAIAIEGFSELAHLCRAAIDEERAPIEAVSLAYLKFASEHPAVYEAMFQQSIDAEFASKDAPREMRDGFEVLREVLGDSSDGTVTETFWAALHGLSQLERAGRLRDGCRGERVRELAQRFID
ncbi:TetR/AcrR family transcriptional regulator [Brachybacterium paraconglomeratum]|uniref:TetR/AcrR family transcriptional regulator n=1 Tax=Brachybacterium paraconglomeratum TaxID=173362 RepID=UPI0037C60E84